LTHDKYDSIYREDLAPGAAWPLRFPGSAGKNLSPGAFEVLWRNGVYKFVEAWEKSWENNWKMWEIDGNHQFRRV